MPLACARGASSSTVSSTSGASANGPRFQIEPAGFDLGEIENLLDQRQQRFARSLRRLGVSELLGRERRVEQQVGHAEHAVERRADLVADHGEEARLGAVGGFRLVARVRQRALGLDAVGDVAADALHLGAGFAAHRDFAPGDPARAIAAGDFLVVHARAVGQHRRRALRRERAIRMALTDQFVARLCRRARSRRHWRR